MKKTSKSEKELLIDRIVEQMKCATVEQLRTVWCFCSRFITD